jgi:hypothetical protein
VDLSAVGLSADPAAREALIVALMSRYQQGGARSLDLWAALAAFARPGIALATAPAIIATVISLVAVRHAALPVAPMPTASWLLRQPMPTALEIVAVMSERAR